MTATFSVGVDIGGTFTDCVVVSNDRVVTGKVPTTPNDRSVGFFGAIEDAARHLGLSLSELLVRTDRILHGTTTGVNAVVSRTGAKVGLVTTAGHGDVMLMMKGSGRTTGVIADMVMDEVATRRKPEPFVTRKFTAEIEQRMDRDGDIIVPLDEEKARGKIQELLDTGVEAIGISLLWSVKNPEHERRLAEIVRELAPHVFVTCGSDLVSRIGEFERTVTTVFNAYIGPLMLRYVDSIVDRARELGYQGQVLFAQSAGGAISAEEAKVAPVLTMQSGPVAGVMNSAGFGLLHNEPNIITTDVGGTTLDVSVIRRGEPLMRDSIVFDRFEMAMPMLDIESIGAGGGSIAWLDESGRLNVGPQSAGADPGPACYGRGGTEPTVTDADVALGIIDPESFLNGSISIDRGLSEAAIARVGSLLGLDVYATAAGINRLVDAKMADLIRRVTEFRGNDPRTFALLAFGGGGPVHAAAFARGSGVRRVIVPSPELAPVWSAGGAANLDIVHMYFEPVSLTLPTSPDELEKRFQAMEGTARDRLATYGFSPDHVSVSRTVRMKHNMQIFDVEVPVPEEIRSEADVAQIDSDFTAVYEERFGRNSGSRDSGVQITGLQLRARGIWAQHFDPNMRRCETVAATWAARPVYWDETAGFVDTPVLKMQEHAGGRVDGTISGPALVEFPNTVIVIRPEQVGWFDDAGNFVIDVFPGEGE
jgi:N-methylhydantoinase A